MNWKQKIEAQIEWLRTSPLDRREADTMQALLDVAVAADALTYADAITGAETWGEMKRVLDKLREVSDV